MQMYGCFHSQKPSFSVLSSKVVVQGKMLCISMAVPSIAGDLCFFIFQVIAPGTDVVVFNVPLGEDSKTQQVAQDWHLGERFWCYVTYCGILNVLCFKSQKSPGIDNTTSVFKHTVGERYWWSSYLILLVGHAELPRKTTREPPLKKIHGWHFWCFRWQVTQTPGLSVGGPSFAQF